MATSGKSWEWHNTEVGVGYQAKHVVRQKSFAPITDKIIDMRGPVPKRISNCAGLSTTDTIIPKCKSGATPKEGTNIEKSKSLASIDKKKLKKMEKKSRRKEEKVAKAARKELRKEMRKDKKKE